MKVEELFFDELKNENRCVKVRNTIDYCKEFSGDTENIEVIEKLRKIIEPWLSGILQSEHLALLIGAGLTQSVCCIADVPSSSMGTADFKEYQEKIDNYAQKAAQKMGRGKYNIEDQIRTSLELLSGYEIDENINAANELSPIIDDVLESFGNSILRAESEFVKS